MSVPTIVVCVTHNFRMIGTTNLEEVEVVASVYYEHFYLFWDGFWAYELFIATSKNATWDANLYSNFKVMPVLYAAKRLTY